MAVHGIPRSELSVLVIHANDPLGGGVEEQDLPGVLLLGGCQEQVLAADADLMLVFVGTACHPPVLFLGVEMVSQPPRFDTIAGGSHFEYPPSVDRNKRQNADLVPFATYGHVIIGVPLAPEQNVGELAQTLHPYVALSETLHFGGEGEHDDGIPDDFINAVQEQNQCVEKQYVV